jgi:DNA-binding NtrC family response regulator
MKGQRSFGKPEEGEIMETDRRLTQLKTLLVDDDEFIRDAITLAFRQRGYPLRTAETAEKGRMAMEEEPFDIISDYRMPGTNGLEFLKAAVNLQPAAVKLLISATGDHRTVASAYAIGAQDFLQKPFTLKTLWATLGMHIGKKNGTNHAFPLKLVHASPARSFCEDASVGGGRA